MKRSALAELLWLVVGILGLAGCSLQPTEPAPQAVATVGPAAMIYAAEPPPRPTAAPPALSAASSPAISPRPLAVRQTLRVRVGYLGTFGESGLFVGVARSYYAEQGLELQTIPFDTSTQLLQTLSAGQLEVGTVPVSAVLFGTLAQGAPLTIVAEAGGAPAGAGSAGLAVRPDLVGRLRTPTDLRGFRIALPARGDWLEVELAALLRTGWLARTDVEMIVMPIGDIGPALEEGSIDGAMVTEPSLTLLDDAALARVWRRSDRILPNHQIGALLYSNRFLVEQPLAARRYMTAYLRSVRLYNDVFSKGKAGARSDLLGILSRATLLGGPPVLDRIVMPGLNPNGMVNVETLRQDQQYFLVTGQQRRAVDLPAVVDAQFAAYAITQLGEYR